MITGTPWKPSEDNVLIGLYERGDKIKDMAASLPRRSMNAISGRIEKLCAAGRIRRRIEQRRARRGGSPLPTEKEPSSLVLANAKFEALLEASGAKRGVVTAASTKHPRQIRAEPTIETQSSIAG